MDSHNRTERSELKPSNQPNSLNSGLSTHAAVESTDICRPPREYRTIPYGFLHRSAYGSPHRLTLISPDHPGVLRISGFLPRHNESGSRCPLPIGLLSFLRKSRMLPWIDVPTFSRVMRIMAIRLMLIEVPNSGSASSSQKVVDSKGQHNSSLHLSRHTLSRPWIGRIHKDIIAMEYHLHINA